MVLGVVHEVFRALAGVFNHSRSVSRPLRSFFSFSFSFVHCIMSRLMKLGSCAAALDEDEEYVSTNFLGPSKGGF